MATPEEIVASSRAVRLRIIELVRSSDTEADDGAAAVPACPGWTVDDVVRHLVGAAQDAIAGRLDGVASDDWTAAQVTRLGHLTIAQLCKEWEAIAADFDRGLAAAPSPLNLQAVMDLSTHEHDLRHALGRPGAQDDASVTLGRQFVEQVVGRRDPELFTELDALGLDDFEVMRSTTGRRSARQLADRGIDVARVEQLILRTPFTLSTVDIVERD